MNSSTFQGQTSGQVANTETDKTASVSSLHNPHNDQTNVCNVLTTDILNYP